MPKFSARSLDVLAELHTDLQTLFRVVIQYVDIALVCGYRGREAQHKAFLAGKSKVDWPNSRHNKSPSNAVDWQLCPDSKKVEDYYFVAGIIKGIALALFAQKKMFHNIRTGSDFNSNNRVSDDGWDAGHTELVVPK